MKVDCALLCDAVTVREGLLHVLGGGVTRVNRQSYPAPMGVALALRILVHPTEASKPHTAVFIVQTSDGARLVEGTAEFGLTPGTVPDLAPGEQLSLPLQLPLQTVPLPSAGGYSVEVLIDGIHQVSIPFQATLIEQIPGLGG